MAKWARLAVLLVLGACVPGDDSAGNSNASAAGPVERDSAGIIISVNPGWQAHTALGWEVSQVPDLEIGATAESSAGESQLPQYEFDRIRGVRQLRDGRVVVVDGGSNEVRFFDSRGQFLHQVGRTGRGPGEFEGGPVLVPSFNSDTLALYDTRLARFQLLSVDTDSIRVVLPVKWVPAPPVGFIDRNALSKAEFIRQPTAPGPWERPVTFTLSNVVTGNRIVVDSFTVRLEYLVFKHTTPWAIPIPFSTKPAGVMMRNGPVITDGISPEIKQYDFDGRLRRIIRVDEPPRRVGDSEMERYVESAEARRYRKLTDDHIYRDMPIPETMPTFQSLLCGDEGWLWAQLYGWDPADEKAWLVFDPDLHLHGSTRTPAGLDIQQVGSDFILGVRTDEMGTQHVQRYRLDRSAVRGDSRRTTPHPD